MPNSRSANRPFLLSNSIFLCIFVCVRRSDLVIVIWHAKPSKLNKGLLCCQGIQLVARKRQQTKSSSKERQEVFVTAEAYLHLRICPQHKFAFYCIRVAAKFYWHTNYLCFQIKVCLPSANNGFASADKRNQRKRSDFAYLRFAWFQ